MINYIELLVEMNKACQNCQRSRSKKSKGDFEDVLFSAISTLNAVSNEQISRGVISYESGEEIFDFICHLSMACNDCSGNGNELQSVLKPHLDEARQRASRNKERIERKVLAKKAESSKRGQGVIIDFPSR